MSAQPTECRMFPTIFQIIVFPQHEFFSHLSLDVVCTFPLSHIVFFAFTLTPYCKEFLFLLEIVWGDLVWLLCDMLCCRSGLLLEESNCFIPVLIICSNNASVRHKCVIVNLLWLRKPQTSSFILKKSTKGLTLNWLSQLILSGYLTFISPACSDNSSHISFRFVRMAVIRIFVNDLATTKRE